MLLSCVKRVRTRPTLLPTSLSGVGLFASGPPPISPPRAALLLHPRIRCFSNTKLSYKYIDPSNHPQFPDEFNASSYYIQDRISKDGLQDKTAVICADTGDTYTYHDIDIRTNRMANLLRDIGVGLEDRVMLDLSDSIEFVDCFFGALKNGAATCFTSNIPYIDGSSTYLHALNLTRSKVFFSENSSLKDISTIVDELRFLEHIVVRDLEDVPREIADSGIQVSDLQTLWNGASSDPVMERTHRDDLAYCGFTSGSSGPPKAVAHTHYSIASMYATSQEAVDANQDIVRASTVSIKSCYGVLMVILYVFGAGGTAILNPNVIPKNAPMKETLAESILQSVDKYKATSIITFPIHISDIAKLAEDKENVQKFNSVEHLMTGGTALPRPIRETFTKEFDVPLCEIYGCCEVGLASANYPHDLVPESVGRVEPGIGYKITDPNGMPVQIGEHGRLFFQSPGLASGYVLNKKKTKEAFCGEWYDTGDIANVDEHDHIWLHGRADDRIKSILGWINPLRIENIILAHENVIDCAVVGSKIHEDGSTTPCAFVVCNLPVDQRMGIVEPLRELIKLKESPYLVPEEGDIVFVEEIPRNPNGKIMRRKLSRTA